MTAISKAPDWPDGMELVLQLREAAGLFSGAMPISPKQAWEEALAEVRRLRGAFAGLTDQERDALDKLADAINAIRALPSCHAGAERELVPHFHAIQQSVMARAAVRAHPDVFSAEDDFR